MLINSEVAVKNDGFFKIAEVVTCGVSHTYEAFLKTSEALGKADVSLKI